MAEMLDKYNEPQDIRNMSLEELDKLSLEIREFLIEKVSKNGGHLAPNLGVVELTLSLYNVFDFSKDRVIWDVGHQAYVHKILTGRKDRFDTLRKFGGLSGFPKREESEYDMFDTGHSSTSISAAIGMARARDIQNKSHEVIAVIGDGALTGGMALEALNDLGYSKTNVIIVLNDNQMSIEKNVGGMSTYLSKIRVDPKYNKFRDDVDFILRKIPNIGEGMAKSIEKVKGGIKQMLVPGMLFEDMGIKYLGPIDGHNIKELSKVMSKAKGIKGPVLIHVITKKGKGYEFAEKNPGKFHGVGPFDLNSGECFSEGIKSYSSAFSDAIQNVAEKDNNVVAITAAMRDGTGLKAFSEKYPKRFFDIGIAEEHAVTLAAGMAKEGLRPVFAVYSTFLQRAYDQILHDVCIQKLPVIFAIDRAGLVGEDGETHQGIFDLSYLSHMPNMTILCPKCTCELSTMMEWAIKQNYPIAIRYPRGGDNIKVDIKPIKKITLGKWEELSEGDEITIVATGKMVQQSILAQEKLKKMGINVGVVNACFVKPIDEDMLLKLMGRKQKILTIEENIIHGGLGSSILEYTNSMNYDNKITCLGFKDQFVPHGTVDILYKLHKLDVAGIVESVIKIV